MVRSVTGLDAAPATAAVRVKPPDSTAAPSTRRPGQQHVADVRVGRARLVEQVVAVVPPRHQAEVAHRREGCGPGADDDRHVAAQDLEPGGVARLRPLVGGEPHVATGPEGRGEGGVDPGDVAVVGHDEHAAPTAGEGRRGCRGQGRRPVLLGCGGGQRQPRRCGRVARGEPRQVGRPRGIPAPGAARGRSATGSGSGVGASSARAFSAAAWRGGTASRSTSPRVPAQRGRDLGGDPQLGRA